MPPNSYHTSSLRCGLHTVTWATTLVCQLKLNTGHHDDYQSYDKAWYHSEWFLLNISNTLPLLNSQARTEGVLALYKGFFPAFARMGPWNIIFFVVYEKLQHSYPYIGRWAYKYNFWIGVYFWPKKLWSQHIICDILLWSIICINHVAICSMLIPLLCISSPHICFSSCSWLFRSVWCRRQGGGLWEQKIWRGERGRGRRSGWLRRSTSSWQVWIKKYQIM